MTTTKNCPYCDELISINAIKCKHCGSMLVTHPTPSSNLDPLTFTKISLADRYEIISEIGRGGMATVYKAVQKNLQRTVALKVIHQNLIHDQEFLERFHSEARIAASLNHPNIVSIYDEGIENGVHFISMEYLDGEDLHHIIKTRGKLSVEQTVPIISSIADSLDYIHRKGLIHRDIKTSNILVANNQRAVLTDFGIARALSGSKLSQTGSVLGTPEYMSPEQADGIGAEPRSDLYSLGVVMYECLTGCVPFSGENPVATIYKIINSSPPPINKFNSSLPSWIQSVVGKSLQKNPMDRFSSGKEFSFALKERKIFDVKKNETVQKRTQKIDVNDLKIKKTNQRTIKSQSKIDAGRKRSNLVGPKRSKPIYFIGTAILLLLIAILVMLFKDINFGKENIEDLISDPQYQKLSKEDQSKVVYLIESGDRLLNSHQLAQPPGNNALEMYKAVLKIHSSNSYAKGQIGNIFEELSNQAKNELKNGETEKANDLITLLNQYFPDKRLDLYELVQNSDNTGKLIQVQEIFAKESLTLEELAQTYAIVQTVLSREPDNGKAKEYLKEIENRFSQLGESYYTSHRYQSAINVYQKAREYFPSNDNFLNRISDCSRKIESETLVVVPELLGKTFQDASILIVNNSDFVLGSRLLLAGPPSKRGLVVSQSPSAGDRVRRGTAIILSVGE